MKVLKRHAAPLLVITLIAFTAACAARTAERARSVSVNVHAALAAADDAEMTLCNPQPDKTCQSILPAWTTEKHRAFSARMIVALKAGKALNEGVRVVPVTGQAKADLATVSAELGVLTELVEGVLPPESAVRQKIGKATTAVLQLLPLFLE